MNGKQLFHLVIILISLSLFGCTNVSVSTGNYPDLIRAAERGDIAAAEQVMLSGELLNFTLIVGDRAALHMAAMAGQDEMVKWLLARDANPFNEDISGNTPADVANTQGHSDTEKILRDYMNLLVSANEAFQSNDISEFSELLEGDYRGDTLLHIYAQIGHAEGVETQIDAGDDVNAQNVLDITPLHRAATIGNLEIVTMLVENGADVNQVNAWIEYVRDDASEEMLELLNEYQ